MIFLAQKFKNNRSLSQLPVLSVLSGEQHTAEGSSYNDTEKSRSIFGQTKADRIVHLSIKRGGSLTKIEW